MRIIVCLCTVWLGTLSCQATVSIDSLRHIWSDASATDSLRFEAMEAFYTHYGFSLPDTTLSVARAHYNLARKREARQEMAAALNERAIALYLLGDPDGAMKELRQTLEIASGLSDSTGIARAYANIGNIYRDQEKYQEATRNYFLSLGILEAKQAYQAQADVINNLGLIYEDVKMYELSLDYFKQALQLYEKLGMQDKVGNIWLNIGAVYAEKGDHRLAIDYYKKSAAILKAHNHDFSLGDSYHMLARAYQELSHTDTALFFIQKSEIINEAFGNASKIIPSQILKADLVIQTDLNEATKLGEEVLDFAREQGDFSMKANAYKLLYKCYKLQSKYAASLGMHESYMAYTDSMRIEESKIAVVREAIRSEFETKLFNNQLENEKKEAKLKLDQLHRIYAIILAGLLLIFAILLYARAQVNAQRRQKEQLLDEIEKLKTEGTTSAHLPAQSFELNREKIAQSLGRKLNETDWNVLNILLADPVISNKEIAEKAFLTVDGIGSSLRRMYVAFDIKESKYKKISLLMEAMKISNSSI